VYHGSSREATNASTSSVTSVALDSSLPLPPASVTSQNQQELSTMSEDSSTRGNGSRGRGGRGGRRGRRGVSGSHTMSGTIGRAFSGQLTRTEDPPVGSLQGDAPEFRPGQPVQPRE